MTIEAEWIITILRQRQELQKLNRAINRRNKRIYRLKQALNFSQEFSRYLRSQLPTEKKVVDPNQCGEAITYGDVTFYCTEDKDVLHQLHTNPNVSPWPTVKVSEFSDG